MAADSNRTKEKVVLSNVERAAKVINDLISERNLSNQCNVPPVDDPLGDVDESDVLAEVITGLQAQLNDLAVRYAQQGIEIERLRAALERCRLASGLAKAEIIDAALSGEPGNSAVETQPAPASNKVTLDGLPALSDEPDSVHETFDVREANRKLCAAEGHVLSGPVRPCLRCHEWFDPHYGSPLKAPSPDPYTPACEGGSGGPCCSDDCEKCWPDEPSEKASERWMCICCGTENDGTRCISCGCTACRTLPQNG